MRPTAKLILTYINIPYTSKMAYGGKWWLPSPFSFYKVNTNGSWLYLSTTNIANIAANMTENIAVNKAS
jgi:hypothetical protein